MDWERCFRIVVSFILARGQGCPFSSPSFLLILFFVFPFDFFPLQPVPSYMALIEMCKSGCLSLRIVENLLLLFIRIGYLCLDIWKGMRCKGRKTERDHAAR